ncbi:hypothetical protein Bca4012_009790 [Brassica carinata]|uniref:Uncharacterized protein n=1 Tax=Brassica carinata TaxID=52824 RepID=A0A8X7S149_BRACI|nr:hypothetical protein Bca52824_035021 [Brassica carinata]
MGSSISLSSPLSSPARLLIGSFSLPQVVCSSRMERIYGNSSVMGFLLWFGFPSLAATLRFHPPDIVMVPAPPSKPVKLDCSGSSSRPVAA